MRTDAIFIGVEVADHATDDPNWPPNSRRPAPSTSTPTPAAHVELVEHNIDECILCDMCIAAAPPGRSPSTGLYATEAVRA